MLEPSPMPTRNYSVRWSVEDNEYVATCDTHPSLSWLDPDPLVALKGLVDMLAVDAAVPPGIGLQSDA
jgi:hypothetical protein